MQNKWGTFLFAVIILSLVFVPAHATSNLVSNGDFENGNFDYWTETHSGITSLTVQSLVKQEGTYAADYKESQSSDGVKYGWIQQDINCNSSSNSFSIYTFDHASGGTGSTHYDIYLDSYSTSFPATSTTDGTWGSWVHHTVDMSTFCGGGPCYGTKTLSVRIGFGPNHIGDVYVDNIDWESRPPIVYFIGTPVRGKAPLTVQFLNNDLHTTHYAWVFGDGNDTGNTLPNPSHLYTTAGMSYDVRHNAYNDQTFNQSLRSAYITTNATVATSFNATPTSGSTPLTVQFNDTSVGDPYAWNWSFGDGSLSTVQNPSHVYTNAGTFTVNLSITAPDGSASLVKSGYITVSGVAEHSGIAIGGNIYSLPGYSALSAVQMTLVNVTNPAWTSTIYTNNTGYYSFNNLSDSTSMLYVVSAVKSGYLDTATDQFSLTSGQVAAKYADKSFGMEVIGSSSANQGVGGKYAPNLVRFTVKYWNGTPIKGVNVTAQGFESTAGNGTFASAATILGTLFGFDFVTTPIQSQLMSGTTGDDGAIAFWMIENVNYHITFTLNGVELVSPVNIYPKEYEYPITVSEAAVPNANIDTNWSVSSGSVNNSYSYITVTYTDKNFQTSSALVTFSKVINSSYSSLNYSKSFSGSAAANFSVTYNPITHKGDQYYVTLHTENNVFGVRNVTNLITIPGRPLDLRLKNNDYYAWIALIAIYLIAQMGGSARTRDVAILMTIIAGFLALSGWLSITTLLLQTAVLFAILYYIRTGEEQP